MEDTYYITEKAHILCKFAQAKLNQNLQDLVKIFGKSDFKKGIWSKKHLSDMFEIVQQSASGEMMDSTPDKISKLTSQ